MQRLRTIRALFTTQVSPPPAPLWDVTVTLDEQPVEPTDTVKVLALLEAYAASPAGEHRSLPPSGWESLDERRRRIV
jgi:hypothetical protein